MYPVSARFLDAIRAGGGRWYGYVEAWFAGEQLRIPDVEGRAVATPVSGFGVQPFGVSPFGGSVTYSFEQGVLPLIDGAVTVDGSTPGVRRVLNATFAPAPGLWDLLAPVGTELRAFTAIRFPDGTVETVPQGVFDVDVQSISYGADGKLVITAPDRWVRVQRARFLTPRQLGGDHFQRQIADLIEEVVPGVAVSDDTPLGGVIPPQTEDRDRAGFIEKVATAGSLDVYFDRTGVPVIRAAPALSTAPVWDVDAGDKGVLLSADRERNRQKTYNIVVVNGTRNDGASPFPTQYVWDNDPNSSTFAGPGTGADSVPPAPLDAGPFGQRPFFYSSPLLEDAAQAQSAGASILNRVSGLAAQLTLSAVANPALDDGDTIRVTLPRERRDRLRPVERHITDRFTVPLVPHRNPQQIYTRSTVADVEES